MKMRKRGGFIQSIVWAHVVMVFIGIGVMYLFAKRDSAHVSNIIPVYGKVPNLLMTDQHGKPFALDSLKGKVWIADLLYTECPGPCPIVASRLAELRPDLDANPDLRLISISVDPKNDTPEKLNEFSHRFGVTNRWRYLVGDAADVSALAANVFDVPLRFQPGSKQPILHTTKLILVDRAGYVRGSYESLEERGLNAILRDAKRLLAK